MTLVVMEEGAFKYPSWLNYSKLYATISGSARMFLQLTYELYGSSEFFSIVQNALRLRRSKGICSCLPVLPRATFWGQIRPRYLPYGTRAPIVSESAHMHRILSGPHPTSGVFTSTPTSSHSSVILPLTPRLLLFILE